MHAEKTMIFIVFIKKWNPAQIVQIQVQISTPEKSYRIYLEYSKIIKNSRIYIVFETGKGL